MTTTSRIHKKIIKDYWIQKLSEIEESAWPVVAASQKKAFKTVSLSLDSEVVQAVQKLANQQPKTAFAIYLTFYYQLLVRYFHHPQVYIASPDLTESLTDVASNQTQLTYFRLQALLSQTVKEWLLHTRSEIQEVIAHQTFDSEEIFEQLASKGIDLSVLAQYGFYYSQAQTKTTALSNVQLLLKIEATEDNGYALKIRYASEVYSAKLIQQMARHYQHLLKNGLGQLDCPVGEMTWLTEEEEDRLIYGYNQTRTPYPSHALIQDLFDEQALKRPHAIAVMDSTETLTYAQLQTQADQLAAYLRHTSGIQPGDRVGVMVQRSSAWIIGMLAILKAGGCYVPLDPAYPKERLRLILDDTQPKVLLTHSDYLFEVEYYEGELVALDLMTSPQLHRSASELPFGSPPEAARGRQGEAAYIMYTSGSTGTPKGVLVPHRGVVRLVKQTNYIRFSKNDKLLVTGALAFDATTFEVWGMLLNGGTLHIATDAQLLDTQTLKTYIHDHGITMMWFTSSWFNQLVDQSVALFAPLKYLLIGGEKLSEGHVRQVKEAYPLLKIINGYGPTENTTFSICHQIHKADLTDIPLGKPIANSTAYILDEYLRPLPEGVAGEIYLGGDGLAAGYLNQPELTAEKFIAHPFLENQRLYKTGDWGIRDWEGTIRFVGRRDGQVKVRGYRIETGEIEQVMRRMEGVKDALVVGRTGTDGNTELVAYYISNMMGASLESSRLRQQLSAQLPAYMVPLFLIALPKFPLTPNGKADRRALPAPESVLNRDSLYVAPRTELEVSLVEIWQSVLGKEKIGICDHFFELGGHSLKATQVVSRIYQDLQLHIDLGEVFLHPTIETLAEAVQHAQQQAYVSIEPVAEQPYYPLSHAQYRLWVLAQMEESKQAYNIPTAYTFNKAINEHALKAAFQTLLERHESLRTRFIEIDGIPFQQILPASEVSYSFQYHDLRLQTDTAAQVKQLMAQEAAFDFDLRSGSLLRVCLARTQDEAYTFLLTMHHIVSDGWSMEVLIKEVTLLYQAYLQALPNPLPPLRVQYKDYAAWQNARLSGPVLTEAQTYWWGQFSEPIPALELPMDAPRPAVKTYNGSVYSSRFSLPVSTALDGFALQEGTSLFMVLQALVKTLFYTYTRQTDITVGVPMAGRDHPDLEDQIGFYVNTLALRTRFSEQDTFRTLVGNISNHTIQAYQYQYYPFDLLVSDLNIARDRSRSPLFDVMIALQNFDNQIDVEEATDVTVGGILVEEAASPFDIQISFRQMPQGLTLAIEYNTDLFLRTSITRMVAHLQQLAMQVIQHPDVPLVAIDYLSTAEKQQLLEDFNQTTVAYPSTSRVEELFEQMAERYPDDLALVYLDTTLTYSQLNENANQLAHHLLTETSFQPGDLVGVLLERNPWYVMALLAVLKAGGAYLPLSAQYPAEWLRYVCQDSQPSLLITQSDLIPENYTQPVLVIDTQLALMPVVATNVRTQGSSQDRAYVMYTSGSTGKPKGVAIQHQSIIRLVQNTNYVDLYPGQKLLQAGALSFDATTFEIWGMLLNGGAVYLLPDSHLLDSHLLAQAMQQYGIDVMFLTTAWFNQLVDTQIQVFAPLRQLLVGGEKLSTYHIQRVRKAYPSLQISNIYGPTENTTFSVAYPIEQDYPHAIPLGYPIANSTAYILDSNQQLVPIGVEGEIYLGGDGLSMGYVNLPELTDEKFIPHPWKPGEKLYKTGDIGRWREDGCILFEGRKDTQVKLRGHRIELEGIERVLCQHPAVEKAIVLVYEPGSQSSYLVAVYTGDATCDEAVLRAYLHTQLPSYMVPTQFHCIAELPLTPNGKVDKKKLWQDLSLIENEVGSDVPYVAPSTAIEHLLVTIWQEVSGRKQVGIQDNFFMIGGDSIKAIQVVSRMRQAGYRLTIKDIFLYPTIAELSLEVRQEQLLADQSAVIGELPLTPIQQYFFDLKSPVQHHFNQCVMIHAPQGLEEEAIRAVFTCLQNHHDALRMTYAWPDRTILQTNEGTDMPLGLSVFDWQTEPLEEAHALLTEETAQMQGQMDLENGPLMLLGLFRLPDGDRLLVTIHHLVVDGVSWRILLEDMETLYQQYQQRQPLKLPTKTFSFQTWAHRLNTWRQQDAFMPQATYWAAVADLKPEPLPLDYPEGTNQMQDTGVVRQELTPQQTQQLLTQTHQAFGTEINDILLTALAMAIRQTFGVHRLSIDLEGHGREAIFDDIDISRTIGWFTSLYPLTLDMRPEYDLARQIKEVKETLRSIPDKGIGFGVWKYLHLPQEQRNSHQPASIAFNYLGQFNQQTTQQQRTFQLAEEYAGPTESPQWKRTHALDISGKVNDQTLSIALTYSTKQYRAETMQQLMEAYMEALRTCIQYCTTLPEPQRTPSDFTYKKLDIPTLDQLMARYAIEDIYTLSPMQEGMLFQTLFDNDSLAYLNQTSYRLKGNLNPVYIQQSIAILSQRYDILRTLFLNTFDEQPLQLVLKNTGIVYTWKDLTNLPNMDMREQWIHDYKQQDRLHDFELDKGGLMRITVVQVDTQVCDFIWSFHHILMDGWCVSLLISDFLAIYSSLAKGIETPALLPVPPYRTYIQWVERQKKTAAENYWQQYLAGYDTTVGIPRNHTKTDATQRSQQAVSLRFTAKDTLRLTELASQNHATLTTLLQVTWGLLLACYNQCQDVVFGTVVSGRPAQLPAVETMVGLFINTVPVRVKYTQEQTFSELLMRIQTDILESEAYHFYTLADIQALSPVKHHLFDHAINVENYPVSEQIEHILSTPTASEAETEAGLELLKVDAFAENFYDFTLIINLGQELHIQFKYTPDYETPLVQALARQWQSLLEQVLAQPSITLGQLAILSDQEKERILNEWNATDENLTLPATMHGQLEAQVLRTPQAIAIAWNDTQLTYQQLNEQANRMAHYLRENYGLKPNTLVGLMTSRSDQMMIGMWAILKAGGAYLPIDPSYPAQRKQWMLQDADLQLLLTDTESLQELETASTQTLLLDTNLPDLALMPVSNLVSVNQPTDLAYVIYTSGSTGKPKGVMIAHQGNVNMATDQIRQFEVTPADAMLQFASLSFDASVYEICIALYSGATLVLIDKPLIEHTDEFLNYLHQQQVTMAVLPPAYLNALDKERLRGLRVLVTAGEAAHVSDALAISQFCRYYNAYGPTEASVCVSTYAVTPQDALRTQIPIGKPIANTRLYVLDADLKPVPIGVAGELCISGIGVAKGYLNRPELTLEAFVQNPYLPDGKLYRTGDLARWTFEGNLEFLGRKDEQLKIRGFRIEAGEIAEVLRQQAQDVVVMKGLSEELVAAVRISDLDQKEGIEKELRDLCVQQLPHFMVPHTFLLLEEWPLTSSGKVDKAAVLRLSEGTGLSTNYMAPRTALEEKLAALWQEILNKPQIGIHDHFFELGGHSLKATRLVSRLYRSEAIRLELKTLFLYPTIATLAAYIEQSVQGLYEAIPAIEPQATYPISHAQRRLWILQQFEENKTAYNVPSAYTFTGDLNVDALQAALETVICRHEMLRTTFVVVDGEPRQKIKSVADVQVNLGYTDLRNQPDRDTELKQLVLEEEQTVFDLSQGPLLRAKLVQTDDQTHIFLLTLHHIISDGWSMEVFIREVTQSYMAFPEPLVFEPLRIQYKDYAVWQMQQLSGESLATHQAFWWDKFRDQPPVMALPTDYPRPLHKTFHGRTYFGRLSPELTLELNQLARRHDVTLFMVIEAWVKTLLYAYTGQEDLTLGTPLAGRNHPDLENQIGYYINTIALRSRFQGSQSFREFLQQVRIQTLDAFAYQEYPFDRLVDDLSLSRDMSRSPLFDVMIVWQNFEAPQSDIEANANLTIDAWTLENTTSQFDLKLVFQETPAGLAMAFDYNTDLFKKERIERMVAHLQRLAESIIQDDTTPLHSLAYVTEAETQQLTDVFAERHTPYPATQPIHTLFEEIAASQPEASAIVYQNQTWSYSQLNEQANRLAYYLHSETNLRPGDRVAVMLDRHPHYIIALLAILKAGGTYVPVSPTYPIERLRFMLEDTTPVALLTQTDYMFDLSYFSGHIVAMDIQLDSLPASPLAVAVSGGKQAAYIMYTSGTTGKPKGVIVPHQAVVRLVRNTNYVQLTPTDRLLQTGSLTFDATTFEIWGMLLNGGCICLLPEADLLRTQVLKETIREQGITTMWLTSSWFNLLVEDDVTLFEGMKQLLVGGEKLSSRHINRVRQAFPSLQVINGYGPTENTTFSICYPIQDTHLHDIPLGYPVANSSVYILDTQLKLVPVGVEGEIYLGGDGLALGYLNQPELTSEKFIPHPWKANDRLYRTGDQGRWTDDGKVLFVGRRDEQVKIRGYRIELAEIEAVLLAHPHVSQAVVLTSADVQGVQQLTACVVSTGGDDVLEDVRLHMAKHLPNYMIPAEWLLLETIPLTANGKANKEALLQLRQQQSRQERPYEAPQDPIERKLAELWQEVLHVSPIGRNDNFFDLGGHSLRATQLISRLYKQMQVNLDLGQLFAHPILWEMAAQVKQNALISYEEIPLLPQADSYEVASGQQRLWLINQVEGGLASYNMSGSYELAGDFSIEGLQWVFDTLIERHQILRTTFVMQDGNLRQLVHSTHAFGFHIQVQDLSEASDAAQQIDQIMHAEIGWKFDLAKGPLLRVQVIRMSPVRHICLFTMHHIISDGWSLKIMLHELQVLYQTYIQQPEPVNPLQPLRIQYKDYAAWQRQQCQGEALTRHRQYAQEEFGGGVPVLQFPTDFPRPYTKTHKGGYLMDILDAETSQALKTLSQQHGCSLFMTLLAGYNALLYRYTGQTDMVIGTVDAGRHHPDLEDQIGFYVNTLAIRSRFAREDTWTELLAKVRQKVVQVYEHMSYPFDELIGTLQLEWERGRSPLFDIVLSLQNTDVAHLTAAETVPMPNDIDPVSDNNIAVKGYKTEVVASMFDLVMDVSETHKGLVLSVSYSTDLFREHSIRNVLNNFMHVLTHMVTQPESTIDSLTFSTAEPLVTQPITPSDASLDYEFNF